MKNVSFTAVLCLLGSALLLVAQTEVPPKKEAPPEPPLMKQVPPNYQWIVTYTPKTPEKEPKTADEIHGRKMRLRYSPMVLAVRSVKANGQFAVFTTYEAGLKSEAWLIRGNMYETPLRDYESIAAMPKGKGDFPDITWVKAENFKGTVQFKGRKVHSYKASEAEASSGSLPVPHIKLPDGSYMDEQPKAKVPPQIAYIDPDSRLPLLVDDGSKIWTFQYSVAPALPKPDLRIQAIMAVAGEVKTSSR